MPNYLTAWFIPAGCFFFDNAVLVIHIEAANEGIENGRAAYAAKLRHIPVIADLFHDRRFPQLAVQRMDMHFFSDWITSAPRDEIQDFFGKRDDNAARQRQKSIGALARIVALERQAHLHDAERQ